MTASHTTFADWLRGRLGAALGAFLAIALYYGLFYLSPKQVGANDPDRFYHLALSEMMARQGLIRQLPQVEDLGWGHYFPDKEFLFHVFTGMAHWIGGPEAVLLLVPIIGAGIVLLLFAEVSRTIRPWPAFALVIPMVLLTGHFVFRLSMLRPHLLAILFFCLLLSGILQRKYWLTLLAALGFSLSYHAYYVVLMVGALAALVYWEPALGRRQIWVAVPVGLLLGIVVNPYFPSNLVMSWIHVQIALGIDVPAGVDTGAELVQYDVLGMLQTYGVAHIGVLAAAAAAWRRRLWPVTQYREFWFLMLTAVALTALGMKSRRAMEYAIPSVILLSGYTIRSLDWRGCLPSLIVALMVSQGYYTVQFYKNSWTLPQVGYSVWYFNAITAIPERPAGAKVFNCDWSGSPYLFYFRPDLRFVDILDPVLLWKVSRERYVLRQELIKGNFRDPAKVLRSAFRADYVLCDEPPLNRQMDADPARFRSIAIRGASGEIRLYQLLVSGD